MKFLLFALIHVMGQAVIAELNLPPKIFYNLYETKDIYDKYLVKFNKNYDEEEYNSRYEIFKENLKEINEFNKKSNLTVYGINQFSDLTFEEFVNSYTGMSSNIDVTDLKVYKPTGSAPWRLDYRENGWVTEVKQQGACNTGYIFSAIGSIEGQHARDHGQLISLSEQQVLDCHSGDGCKTGGNPFSVMKFLAQEGGSMSEQDYSYEGHKRQCRIDKGKIKVPVTGGLILDVANEEYLKHALAYTGPLSIEIYISREFKAYQGGIFDGDCDGPSRQALLLVGYDSAPGKEFWIIKNSWSSAWGEKGYMRMELGKYLCNIGSFVATAYVAL